MPFDVKTARTHAAAFGLLRLVFAALVVVSHSPEIVDGNRSREILTQLFGTLSFGEIAVDGFFLISGYLIAQSFATTPSTVAFCIKRAGRIMPGYIVASLLCVFVLAPWVGASESILTLKNLKHFAGQLVRMLQPDVPGAFSTLPYAMLNGSMWTIAYEVRCYAAVVIFGLLFGSYKQARRVLLLGVSAVFLITIFGISPRWSAPPSIYRIFGNFAPTLRFAGAFGTGALFYAWREKIPLTATGALIASAALVVAMFYLRLAEPAFCILGGYVILFVAFAMPATRLSRFVDRTDISYGLYLYAWPIGSTLVFLQPRISPWSLCATTLVLGSLFGAASWFLIEKPALRIAHKLTATAIEVIGPRKFASTQVQVLSSPPSC